MTSETKRTTVFLDASVTRDSGCLLRVYRTVIEGFKSGKAPNDVEMGSAFHAYRHTYVKLEHDTEFTAKMGGTGSDMLQTMLHACSLKEALYYWDNKPMYIKSKKQHLNRTYLEQLCHSYTEHYRTQGNEYATVTMGGKPLIELRIPYPYYVTPEGDIEFILCGTIDRIIYHRALKFYAINDYKTTSLWDQEKFFRGYKMSTQFLFYKFLIKLYAKAYPDSSIAEIHKHNPTCVVDGIFLKTTGAEFKQSDPISYSASQEREFELGLNTLIFRLIQAIREPQKVLYR